MGDAGLLDKQQFNIGDWPKALLDLFTIGDKLYALPQEASTLMFYYRTDLVEKWGLEPPGSQGYSWDQLIANARKAQAKIAEEKLDMFPLLMGVKAGHAPIHF
jgi:multiple sugar transport system substrate-binding protein